MNTTKKKEKLADQERVLREKYQLLRQQKEEQEKKDKDFQASKLEEAKRIIAAVGIKGKKVEPEKTSGFKRPTKIKKPENDNSENLPDDHNSESKKRTLEESEDPLSTSKDHLNTISDNNNNNYSSHETNDYTPHIRHTSFSKKRPKHFDDSEKFLNKSFDELPDSEYYPTTIFVGDLPENITETKLHETFGKYGTIDCIRNITGKDFAFIKFLTRQSAKSAIDEMNGQMLGGMQIRASRAKIPSYSRRGKDGFKSERRSRKRYEPSRDSEDFIHTTDPIPAEHEERRLVQYDFFY
eukprot:TRINITY_DN9005_c0_g1_i1.p1 TRINITY_DN9005_c0_g1~~TRINITY_DN9005_c0_g1_i1.p1  ORF type:complete len:296 (-),score=79.30 TRINITY_DN9005_c0_g1_i1:59-946(-)